MRPIPGAQAGSALPPHMRAGAEVGPALTRSARSCAALGETEEMKHWTRGEAETLIALARQHEPRFAPFIVLLYATGGRRGEGPRVPVDGRGLRLATLTIRRLVVSNGCG